MTKKNELVRVLCTRTVESERRRIVKGGTDHSGYVLEWHFSLHRQRL